MTGIDNDEPIIVEDELVKEEIEDKEDLQKERIAIK